MNELTIAVSDSVLSGSAVMPLNGLRHPPTEMLSGWYIWSGELKDDIDFFKPVHVSHVIKKYPFIEKYLSLPPGHRFQIDDNGYEDIWTDDDLLKV